MNGFDGVREGSDGCFGQVAGSFGLTGEPPIVGQVLELFGSNGALLLHVAELLGPMGVLEPGVMTPPSSPGFEPGVTLPPSPGFGGTYRFAGFLGKLIAMVGIPVVRGDRAGLVTAAGRKVHPRGGAGGNFTRPAVTDPCTA